MTAIAAEHGCNIYKLVLQDIGYYSNVPERSSGKSVLAAFIAQCGLHEKEGVID